MLEVNDNKCDRIRNLGEVNIDLLLERVNALANDDWDDDEDYQLNHNKTASLQLVQHIIFRFTKKQIDPFEYRIGSKWASWEDVLQPIMEAVVKSYGYNRGYFPKVMLAKLAPGAMIPPHIDGNVAGNIPHKIHLPITTNPKSFFFIEQDRFQFEVGAGYEVNNGRNHRALNAGSGDRIHLIFEYLDFNAQPKAVQEQMNNPVMV
ncbi:MAG: aspartyl/asparaginyl beta-hydroxylase domain-containing protein [Flavobacteriales bacterium]|nr:aspartyl/asparaginyl beta-hydroxylase domain-containing protein [Flavobacteriales bacterium]